MLRAYATPEAFRMALQQRLRARARKDGRDLTRLRQLLVFDRFLARVSRHLGDDVIVKGGITLELRLDRARTTKDVDLWMKGEAGRTLERLQKLGELDLGDFLSFVVDPDERHPVMKGMGMVYEGRRFRCEARLAGKLYGGRFGIDVGFAEPSPSSRTSSRAALSSTSSEPSGPRCGSTLASRTWRRSSTPTPCPENARTPG